MTKDISNPTSTNHAHVIVFVGVGGAVFVLFLLDRLNHITPSDSSKTEIFIAL